MVGKSRLMLMIGAKDDQLKQWTITDRRATTSLLRCTISTSKKKPDPDLFKVDYARYDERPRRLTGAFVRSSLRVVMRDRLSNGTARH